MTPDTFAFNTALTSLQLVNFERPCNFQLTGLQVRPLYRLHAPTPARKRS